MTFDPAGILQRVFTCQFNDNYGFTIEGSNSEFFIIPGNGAPRWIIPNNPKLCSALLGQWHPYGAASKLKWALIRLLYSVKCLTYISRVESLIANSIWVHINEDKKESAIPLIYIGTPGPQQKAVVTLIDVNNGSPISILKIPLGHGSSKSILREGRLLTLLEEFGVKGVPKLVNSNDLAGQTVQTAVAGKLISRKLKPDLIYWLADLPRSGKMTSCRDQQQRLSRCMGAISERMPTKKIKLLESALAVLNDESEFPCVFVHGDFAPWNIKRNKAQIQVFDWEDGCVDGLPLWDMCHFNFIQSHLFNDPRIVSDFLSGSLVLLYLDKFLITNEFAQKLTLLYMLSMVLCREHNASSEYKAFLIDQIPVVLS